MKFLLFILAAMSAYLMGQVMMDTAFLYSPDFWLWFDGDTDANTAAYYFLFFCCVICLAMFALADYNLAKPVRIKSSDIRYIHLRNKYGFPNNT